MDRETRNRIQRATQEARALLEREYAEQLGGTYDIRLDGAIASERGHLSPDGRILREKLVAAIEHRRAGGLEKAEGVAEYLREAAFTTLNRFVALKMLEARDLVQECISRGEQSSGFREYRGLAPGLLQLHDHGYRLYIESLFDEVSREIGILFDRRDPAGLLWPRRQALVDLLGILNMPELAGVWREDETIGWVYQYFNTEEERRQMRAESQAPRNSRELAVRNQFFTPRYVVEFLADNALGRIWYEARRGRTALVNKCNYLVRRPREVFLGDLQQAKERLWGADATFGPSENVKAVYEGRLAELPEELGPDAYLCAIAVPPDQFATLTGEQYEAADPLQLVARVQDAVARDDDDPILNDVLALWMTASHLVLTSTGGPYFERAFKPVWRAFLHAARSASTAEASGEEARNAVYIPHRAPKDPRDLKVLDPACGSGHFLLYAFDLLLIMYEEAWQDELSPASEVTGRRLRDDYATLDELRRALPGLVLRCNVHGVDIDARCVQIAALALWMRAQRAYNHFGIGRHERPPIARTNIVVAEPMPGEKELRQEFVGSLDKELRRLVGRVFEKMELAGEAGALLKIEDEIDSAIRDIYGETGELFRKGDKERWREAEAGLVSALEKYAERAHNGRTYLRRLFAEDAARGFGFVYVCRQQYDIVLMNPPFGDLPASVLALADKHYPEGRNDIYATFVVRATSLVHERRGFVGVITSRSFVSGRDHRYYRRFLLDRKDFGLHLFLDLGSGVLDGAVVQTAAYISGPQPARWLPILDLRDHEGAERLAEINALWRCEGHTADRRRFTALPTCDFLYDLDDASLAHLAEANTIEPTVGRVTFGLTTKDDFRFVRARWEVPAETAGPRLRWSPFAKGGEYSWFSSDTHLVVSRGSAGAAEMAAFAVTRDGNVASTRRSSRFYYQPAITFSRRSQKGFSARRLRPDACFSDKSGVIVPESQEWLLSLPLVLASSEYLQLINSQSTFGSYEIGPVKRLPVPTSDVFKCIDAWRVVFSLIDEIDARDETSQLFGEPPAPGWSAVDVMRRALDVAGSALRECGLQLDPEVERNQLALAAERDRELRAEDAWFSYLIGVAFGRWRHDPSKVRRCALIGPYDPPPGSAWAASRNREGDARSLLVDDPGHADDMAACLLQLRSEALPESGRVSLEGIGSSDDLRIVLRTQCFEKHLRRYSKSRRRAPIYWQLATSSTSYSVWLYYHRLTKDTLYTVLNEYVTPKLRHEENKLASLVHIAGGRFTASQRKAMAEQGTVVDELRAFRDEVARGAPLWNPDLNDGVIINFAPLWRLVSQHRAWQKECKDCWDKLIAGDYDWAHLAMHLWPERVIPKCAEDRSLAIAHRLEEVFWEQDEEGDWRPREVPDEEVDKLIAARASASVKAALEDLLRVPVPSKGGPGRGKRRERRAGVAGGSGRRVRRQAESDSVGGA